jgi:hypothetical protein
VKLDVATFLMPGHMILACREPQVLYPEMNRTALKLGSMDAGRVGDYLVLELLHRVSVGIVNLPNINQSFLGNVCFKWPRRGTRVPIHGSKAAEIPTGQSFLLSFATRTTSCSVISVARTSP